MTLTAGLIALILASGCAIAQPPPPEEPIQGYQPPEEMVQEALGEFDAYPKRKGLEGLVSAEDLAEKREAHEPGDPPPDAEWVNYWMGKSDQFIYDMIPRENPRSLVPSYREGCPLHLGNIHTLVPVWDKPNTFRCEVGGEEWAPGMEIENPETGEMVTITDDGQGWKPPDGFPQHGKFYFKGAYRLYLIRKLISRPYIGEVDFDGPNPRNHKAPVYALAYAYTVTGEQKYADRTLLILNRLAENYRWYNSRVDTKSDLRNYPYRAYIEDHNFECGHIQTLAATYDMVFESIDGADHVLDFFEGKHGADYDGDGDADADDLRYNIEHNLFGYTWEFLKRGNRGARGNMRMTQLRTMMHLALHFRNDAIIEHAIDGSKGFRHAVMGTFYRDGREHEDSSSYSWGVNRSFQQMRDILEQYEGRQIYTDGLNANEEFGSRYPMIDAWPDNAWCDGKMWGYGDAGTRRNSTLADENREVNDTFLCHEAGLTMMRQGDNYRTRKHVMLYHSNSGQGHGHLDQLMLKTIAYGYDFSADLGYPANLAAPKRHAWTSNTITHPTVIVDETSQPRACSASAELFGRCNWAQVASAYSYNTYPDADLYHRTAAVVEVDEDRHFIVDVFRIVGGTQHDYAFHSLSGENGENFEITCADALQSRPGTLAGEDVEYLSETEKKNGYSWLKDIETGTVDEAFTATWRVGDETGTGYKIHMLRSDGREVFTGRGEWKGTVGRSPLDAYLVVRHSGEEPLQSTYVAVHEPFQSGDLGLSVQRIALPEVDSSRMAAGLRITTADGQEFTFRSALPPGWRDEPRYTGVQSIEIRGPQGALMVNGTPADPAPVFGGEIVDVDYSGNALITESERDLAGLEGHVIYIQNPQWVRASAFNIAAVEQLENGRWRIETELEPILATNSIRESDLETGKIYSPFNVEKWLECHELYHGKPIVVNAMPDVIFRIADMEMADNYATQIVTLENPTDAAAFGAGHEYAIYAFAPGDTWYVCDVSQSDMREDH